MVATHTIEFTVDDETISTDERELSADAIIGLAGRDPSTSYLVELKGKHQESYKDRGTELIKVHPHSTFMSVPIGPTPLS